MKASGIITVAGGVGALVLLGLMIALRGDAPEPIRPPASGPRAGSSSPMAAEGASSRRAALPSPTLGTVPRAQGAAPRAGSTPAQPALPTGPGASEDTGESAQAQAGAAGTAGTAGAAGTVSEVDKALELARTAPREDDRINALRWLGENAAPQQFEAMQDIQIHDPSPAVRQAAEAAVNELRRRRANDAWPGVTPTTDPQDYMRGIASPSP
jgi:hypothetical protein